MGKEDIMSDRSRDFGALRHLKTLGCSSESPSLGTKYCTYETSALGVVAIVEPLGRSREEREKRKNEEEPITVQVSAQRQGT